jgi:peptide-methionine (R)-S-oxide reductase
MFTKQKKIDFSASLSAPASLSVSAPISRRTFLMATGATAVGLAASGSRVFAAEPAAATVTIVPFSDAGQRQTAVRVSKVVKTKAEWRKQLSGESFEVTREEGTERPFTGKYWNQHGKGLYRCICCDTPLFSSETKFESGTGWPSFWEPIAKENVTSTTDRSFGMSRTAVSCTRCDAHLGHVFDDGPKPTGLRYCMNSASLRFVNLG